MNIRSSIIGTVKFLLCRSVMVAFLVAAGSLAAADTNLWPARAASGPIKLTEVVGKAPKDLGRFGQCRIIELSDANPAETEYLVVTEHLKPRGNSQQVPVRHSGGSFRLPMNRYNGSKATIASTAAAKPRGLFIYLTGIIGLTPPEEKLVATFRAAGWHTLVSETSFNFMQRRYELIEPKTRAVTARRLGREVNEHLADKAYAVEALLKLLAKRQPRMLSGRRIVAGGSAGSIALPAVVVRTGKADALILIGTGGNAARIVTESSLVPLGLYKHEGKKPDRIRRWLAPTERREIQAIMYAHTPLDPLRLAARLKDVPTLMIRAELDEMVPAATNDLLHDALGRPERWSLPLNHIMLFGALHLQSGMILGWAEKNLPQNSP